MRKLTFKSFLVLASIFTALLLINPTVEAQSATPANSTKTEKSKDQKVNADVNKLGDIRSKTQSNVNISTSNTSTMSEREMDKVARANKLKANKNTMSDVEREKLIRDGKLAADKSTVRTKEITIVDYPGYPKYIETGNATLDSRNYLTAKMNWIKENPEAYAEILNKDAKVKEEESRKYRKSQQQTK